MHRIFHIIAFFLVLGFFGSTVKAAGIDYNETMSKGLSFYKAGKWTDALELFQRALRAKKGKPLYEKTAIYLHLGRALFQTNQKGLAWKAFEQALYQNAALSLPKEEGVKIRSFFKAVRLRVQSRGAILGATGSSNTSGGVSTSSRKGSIFTWVLAGLSVASLTSGLVFVMNASSNQASRSDWLKRTAGLGYKASDLELSLKPLDATISTQNTFGVVAFIIAGLSAGGAVATALLLKPRSSMQSRISPKNVPSDLAVIKQSAFSRPLESLSF